MIDSINYIDLIKLGVSSLATLLGVVLSWYLKYQYGEYKQKKLDKELSHSKLIQTILDQLLEEYECQRAFILQRHNGGKYKTGKSMTKLSTSFESLEEGVSSEFRQSQNLPMSLYSNFVDDVSKHKAIYKSIDSIDDLITKAFFSQRGTKSAVVYPIKKSSELIALIGFEWTHTSEESIDKMDKIQDDVKTMGETLSKLL
jgi:flagellin-specific chaperone FliS